jgi:hypothetical protein
MSVSIWRRFHGDIVAHVRRLSDAGRYEIAAWDGQRPERVQRFTQQCSTVDAAKARADALARRAFGHHCDFGFCTDWMVWSA